MENREKEDPFSYKRKTTVFVILVHFFVLFFLNSSSFSKEKEKRKSLIVKTKICTPLVIKKTDPQIREEKNKIVKKSSSKKKSNKKTGNAKPKMHRLLDELQMSMNKIDRKEEIKKTSNFTLPSSIEHIHVNAEILESTIQKEKIKYQDLLIEDLKSHLHLPEYGEVKVKIFIDGNGNILDVVPLLAQSKKNENYLKNTLLRLTFPWFNQYFSKDERYEFIITFKNEN